MQNRSVVEVYSSLNRSIITILHTQLHLNPCVIEQISSLQGFGLGFCIDIGSFEKAKYSGFLEIGGCRGVFLVSGIVEFQAFGAEIFAVFDVGLNGLDLAICEFRSLAWR